MQKRTPADIVLGIACGSLLAVAGPASGQAWTPEARSGSVMLSFQHIEVDDHFFSVDVTGVDLGDGYIGRGKRADLGGIEARSLQLRVDYGLSDRLALSAALPYISSKYSGRQPEGEIDDGSYHSAFQDLAVQLRYKAIDGPLVVTPFLAYVMPTHDYEIVGHAAIGRNLRESRIGSYFGLPLYPIFTYLQASYSYTFVEEVLGVSTDRSDLTLAVGYQATPAITVQLFGSHLDTRGGLDWITDFDPHLHDGDHGLDEDQVFHLHDQLSWAEATRAGISLIYSTTRNLDFDLSFSKTFAGENAHGATSTTFSVIWSF